MIKVKKIAIGVDPGKKGFITACIDGNWYHRQIPTIGKEFDIQGILKIFEDFISLKPETIFCSIENVHAIQGAGATSNFSFGLGLGILLTAITTFKIPYEKIHPKKWQNYAWNGVTIQKIPSNNKRGWSINTKLTTEFELKN